MNTVQNEANAAPTAHGSRAVAFGVKGGALTQRREKGLKRLPDGRWQFSWWHEGRYHRKIVPSYILAKAALAKVRTAIAENRYLEREVKPKTTLEEAAQQFLKWGEVNLAPGSQTRDRYFVREWRVFPRFQGKPIASITVQDVEAYRASVLARGVSKRTADYSLSRLRRLFVLAEQWGLSTGNPARAVKMFHADNRRERFLTPEEEARIMKAAPDWLRPAIPFSTATGLRQGELLSLTWGQVDLAGRMLTITADKAKSKKTRHVPLNAAALEAIGTQPRSLDPTAPVFPLVVRHGGNALRSAFRKAVREAKVDPAVVWHTLRHTFASRLVQRGVNLLAVKEILGHSTLVMVQRYAHLAADNLRSAVDTLTVPDLRKTCDALTGGPQGAADDSR